MGCFRMPGAGAKHAELEILICCLGPMRKISEPDQGGADESPDHLRQNVGKDIVPLKLADNGQAKLHGWIQMSAANPTDRIHSDRHRQAPARGDHHPARILALGFVQQDIGDHSITQ